MSNTQYSHPTSSATEISIKNFWHHSVLQLILDDITYHDRGKHDQVYMEGKIT